MSRDGWATAISGLFAVALTVTPGIQRWWLAVPAWATTVWAVWRWSSHDSSTNKPCERTPKPARGIKPDWLDVRIRTIAVSFGVGGEAHVSIQVDIENRSETVIAKLKFFLGDALVSESSGQMSFVPAARKYDVLRRGIPDMPGVGPTLYSPLTVRNGNTEGHLLFFHPSRRTLPFAALVVEDVETKAMWSVPISAEFAQIVAGNPTLGLIWGGSDIPVLVVRDNKLYRFRGTGPGGAN